MICMGEYDGARLSYPVNNGACLLVSAHTYCEMNMVWAEGDTVVVPKTVLGDLHSRR